MAMQVSAAWKKYAMCVKVLTRNVQINKAVVSSGCGHVPKYVGEGVASCGLQVEFGGPNGAQHGPNTYLNG